MDGIFGADKIQKSAYDFIRVAALDFILTAHLCMDNDSSPNWNFV
jgi:hypothetical protein